MKDFSPAALENIRPDVSADDAITFCLTRLFNDNTKDIGDLVCEHCTYEELIGALVLARDILEDTRC